MDEECCTKDKIGKEDFSEEKDPAFDDLDDDAMDYIETEDAQDEGRTSSVVLEEKESADKVVSTEAPVRTIKPNKGTIKRNKGTDKQDGGTDSTKGSTDRQDKGTANQNKGKSDAQTTSTPTPTIFGDDETIAQVLIIISQNKQKENEKGVEIRNVEDTERPRPTSIRYVLTLKPLPKIDPKDKGKKMIDEEGESDTESDDTTEAEKKFKMLAKDEEVAKKVQEEWEAEEEKKRINADKILAEELQKEEREKFTIEQRAKFLHDTIATQRKFLAQQRSEARDKPPTRNQLRNQMMTYLKHAGGKKHSDLKIKTFEEIHVLYERLKRHDQNFVAIGSAKDERQIKELNKDPKKKRVKLWRQRKERVVITIDSEIMETKSFIARLHKVSSPDGNYLVIYRVNGHFRAFNSLIENNQQEWEIVRWRMYGACGVFILDLKDRTVIYMLVERRYPLSKELMQRMLDLGLEVEEESTAVQHL
ncbi:hypothetical protein Tco_1191048, partial [Tanacetum coccineum]